MSKEKINPDDAKFRKTGIIMLIGLVVLILGLNIGREYFPWRYYSIYFQTETKSTLEHGNHILFQGNKVGYIKEIRDYKNGVLIHSKFKQKFRLPIDLNMNILDGNKMELKIIDTQSDFWVEGDTVFIGD